MTDVRSDDKTAAAVAIVHDIVTDSGRAPSTEQTKTLVAAIAEDLNIAAHQAISNEDRLAKVEIQTRVLSKAIVAITDTSETVAPAVQAVKDEM